MTTQSLVLNMNTIFLIAQYNASTVKDLVSLRRINKAFCEIVDEHIHEVWCKVLKTGDIDDAFKFGREYIIIVSVLSRKWYHKDNNDGKFFGKEMPSVGLHTYNGLTSTMLVNRSSTGNFVVSATTDSDIISGSFIAWRNAKYIPEIARYDFDDKFVNNEIPSVDRIMVAHGYINARSLHETPLMRACQEGNVGRIIFLLQCNTPVIVDNMALLSLIRRNDVYPMNKYAFDMIIDLFLEKIPDINFLLGFPHRDNVLKRLIIKGRNADVNHRNSFGDTPLMLLAEREGSLPSIKILIKHGADPFIKDNAGHNMLRPRYVDVETCSYLFDIMIFGKETDYTKIHDAIDIGLCGNEETARLLIEKMRIKGKDFLDHELAPGVTVLSRAYYHNSIQSVKYLISAGANPDKRFGLVPRQTRGYAVIEAEIDRYLLPPVSWTKWLSSIFTG